MVPGSLCRQGCESELPRSMWGRLAASEPAGGVRARVSDGSEQGFQPSSRLSAPAPSPAPPAGH